MGDPDLGPAERGDPVSVRRDDDRHAGLADRPGVDVAQVEPIGLRVDLEERAGGERRRNHPLEVDVGARAPVDLAGGQMADAVHVRIVHGGEHPACGVAVEGGLE